MSRVTTVKCDACGKVKGESNRWFQLAASALDRRVLISMSGDLEACLDLCGEQCLHKAIGEAVKQLTGAQHDL